MLFQGPVLFEDLAVYFSQEECVSQHPAQRSRSRDTPQECLEDMALMGNNSCFPCIFELWSFLGLGLHISSACWYGGVGPIPE